MEPETNKVLASFYVYDEQSKKIYSEAVDLRLAVQDFNEWLAKLDKQGGPTCDDSPIYDARTVARIRGHFKENMGCLLDNE